MVDVLANEALASAHIERSCLEFVLVSLVAGTVTDLERKLDGELLIATVLVNSQTRCQAHNDAEERRKMAVFISARQGFHHELMWRSHEQRNMSGWSCNTCSVQSGCRRFFIEPSTLSAVRIA